MQLIFFIFMHFQFHRNCHRIPLNFGSRGSRVSCRKVVLFSFSVVPKANKSGKGQSKKNEIKRLQEPNQNPRTSVFSVLPTAALRKGVEKREGEHFAAAV